MVKNIYDLAGNVWEWTNELYSSDPRERGCDYQSEGSFYPLTFRGVCDASNAIDSIGFRCRLYIK